MKVVYLGILLAPSISLGQAPAPRLDQEFSPKRQLVINVPAGVVSLYEDTLVVATYKMSPGTLRHRTPRGQYYINEVIFNPPWYPPDREWAAEKEYAPPGSSNPMGRVKMPLGGLLYVHGTTERTKLGRPASHGCIRLGNKEVVELAEYLVRQNIDFDSTRLNLAKRDTRRTRVFKLDQPIEVQVIYEMAHIHQDSLWVYPDVYGLGLGRMKSAVKALEGYGFRIEQTDTTVVRQALIKSKGRTTGMSLLDILF